MIYSHLKKITEARCRAKTISIKVHKRHNIYCSKDL